MTESGLSPLHTGRRGLLEESTRVSELGSGLTGHLVTAELCKNSGQWVVPGCVKAESAKLEGVGIAPVFGWCTGSG